MKKTLLISEIFPPTHGGSGRWFWELYTRLPQEQCIIAAGHHPDEYKFDKIHTLKINRINLTSSSWGIKSITGLKFYWQAFKALKNIIKKENIKSIHCGRCLPEGVLAYLFKKLYNIPYLCYIHGEDIEAAIMSRELQFIVKKVLNNSQQLICNSTNSKQLLIEKWNISDNKITVLNPGVDTNQFIPQAFNIETRNDLGWSNRPVLLTVGRLQQRKGQDMMIKALPEIKKYIPDILYVVIGNGEEKEALQNLVSELHLNDNVQFRYSCDDDTMIQCYQQCDIFILPNRTIDNDIEGFGMVLVEAQSCEKPVIAGDSGGTAETMIINETGYILDCSNTKQLEENIPELLKDKDKLILMGKKARKHIVQTLDWQVHTEKAILIFLK